MLKGKTKIQLFDAVTGKETACYEKTNMVTDAVARLLNGDRYGGINGTCPSVSAGNMVTPVATSALGGIMLWGDNITEDVSNIMPPNSAENTLIGHAGTAYSGDNPLRGSYNGAESGVIEGGYRNVWDFNTDRANGTIKCVTLTSAGGGNSGFRPAYDGDGILSSPYHFNPSRIGTTMDNNTQVSGRLVNCTMPKYNSSQLVHFIARLSDGTFFVRQTSPSSNTTSAFYRVKLPDSADISLTADLALPGSGASVIDGSAYELTNIAAPYIFCADSTYFYTGYPTNTRLLTVNKRLITTGEVLETFTLTIPGQYSAMGFSAATDNNYMYKLGHLQVFNEQLCLYADKYIHRYTLDGSYLETVSLNGMLGSSNYTNVYIYQLNGCMFLNSLSESSVTNSSVISAGTNGCCITDRWEITRAVLCRDTGDYQCCAVTDFASHYPFVLVQGFYSKGSILGINTGYAETKLFRPYLATINNLVSPIEKTSAQTMKIIYDIYKE